MSGNSNSRQWADKEKELYEYWGVEDSRFIGCYVFNSSKHSAQIIDLRKPNFARIPYYPKDRKKSPITISLPSEIKGLISGEYYLFNWVLTNDDSSNPYKIGLDPKSPPEAIKPRWFIEQLFNDRYNDTSKNFESATNFLDTLGKQLNARESTFIYELLQNANDYPQRDEPVDVEFHITDEYIIFMHSGDYFNVRNISGICGINEKEKTANRKAIGYKGIGFKTVFLNNHYVYIKTGDYSFRFDEKSEKIRRLEAPWPILPIWTSLEDVPKEIASVIRDANKKFRVQIALRPDDPSILHSGRRNYEKLFLDVFSDSNLILFIPNIRSVKVYIRGELVRDCVIDSSRWLVSDFEKDLSQEFQALVNKAIDTGKSRIPEKYKDFDCTKVSFAVQKEGRKLIPIKSSHLYCYLPTSASWRFPFLMNTDMIPRGDRDDIEREVYLSDDEETNFNLELAKIAGEKFFEWISSLLKSGKYDYDSVFALVPDFKKCIRLSGEKYSDFIEKFQEGFESSLYDAPFFPILNGKKLEFHTLKEINYDTTGLTCAGFLSDEEILELIDWTDFFPHTSLRDHTKKTLLPGVKAFLEIYHAENCLLDEEALRDATKNEEFQEWLRDQENNDKFLLFLAEKDLLYFFEKEAIFLSDEGDLLPPQKMYFSIDEYYSGIAPLHEFFKRLSLQTRSVLSRSKRWDAFKENFLVMNPADFVFSLIRNSKNWGRAFTILNDPDVSVPFMDFVAENVFYATDLKRLPFLDENGEMHGNFDETTFLFLPKPGLENTATVRNEPWSQEEWVAVISPKYSTKTRKYFQEHFGARTYSESIIIKEIICSYKYTESINASLEDITSNKSFFEFTFHNRECIEDGKLSKYCLSIIDKNGEEWVGSPDSCNIYLRDSLYNEYEELPWLDSESMYAVDNVYYEGLDNLKARKTFLADKFGIRPIKPDIFRETIVLKRSKIINEAITDEKINIDFWRWVKRTATEDREIAKFSSFRIFQTSPAKKGEGSFHGDLKYLYLSNEYQSSSGVEEIILKYAPDAWFVIPGYLEDTLSATRSSWVEFFKKLGVRTTISELIFEKIIPGASELEEDGLPALLGQYYSEITEQWDTVKRKLAKMKIKTRDGQFTPAGQSIMVDVEKTKEPFPDIILPNEVSPEVIPNRSTHKLLMDICKEAHGTVIENISAWQERKVDIYAGDETSYSEEAHLRIIKEMSTVDIETLKSFAGMKSLQLKCRNGGYTTPSSLTFGDIYSPKCLFEANGVTNENLFFLSDDYASIGNSFFRFATRLGVNSRFEPKYHLPLLAIHRFAIYFWSDYALKESESIEKLIESGTFNDTPCVPTIAGNVYSPDKVYARSVSEYVVKRIDRWEDKLPSDQIPENKNKDNDFLNKLGCLEQLSFEDGLMALQTVKSKERRRVILEWMIDDYDNSKKSLIDAYRTDENAIWKNGRGEDKHITSLYALAPESSNLREFFRDNEFVLHLEYITYYLNPEKYRNICNMLQVHVIEEEDMDFVPEGSPDEKLKLFLENRMLIVAGIETPEGWRKAFDKYKKKLEELSFWNCSVISWTYRDNKDICQTTKKFYAKDGVFYFVNDWSSRQVYTVFINALYQRLDCELNRDLFSDVLDPDIESDEIIKPYHTLRTGEFISELAKYEEAYNTYQGPINSGDDEDDDSFLDAYMPGQFADPSEEQESVAEVAEPIRDSRSESGTIIPSKSETPTPASDFVSHTPTSSSTTSNDPSASTQRQSKIQDNSSLGNDGHKDDSDSVIQQEPVISHGNGDASTVSRTPKISQPEEEPQPTIEQDALDEEDYVYGEGYEDEEEPEIDEIPIIPEVSKTKRSPKNYTRKQYERLASVGIPLELESLRPTDEEIDVLGQYGITPEQIADSNYLAQLRLYRNLVNDEHEEPEETLEEFIRNAGKVANHKLKGGKYVQARSAARGVMYISPTVWEKLMDDKWRICVYLDGQGKNFHYINSAEEFLDLVNKDDIVIKITGKEKVDVVNELYSGVLRGVKGTAYTLIRVASHTNMDAVFARYVGEMAENNDGNENSEDY